MAITFYGKGSFGASTGALSITPPVGYADGDLFLLMVESANQTIATPIGWTQVINSPQFTGTAAAAYGVRLAVFYKWVSGVQSNQAIADSINHTTAIIAGFRGVNSTTPFNITAGGVTTPTSTAISCPSVTTTAANCMIVNIVGLDRDASASDASGTFVNANLLNLTRGHDQTSNVGVGGGIAFWTGYKPTAGPTGVTTATTITQTKAYLTVALNESNIRTGSIVDTNGIQQNLTGSKTSEQPAPLPPPVYIGPGATVVFSSNQTIDLPIGIQDGDLLILAVQTDTASSLVSGWSRVPSGLASNIGIGQEIYYLIKQPGIAIPESNISSDMGEIPSARVYLFRGVDPISPFATNVVTSTTNTIPKLISATSSSLVVIFAATKLAVYDIGVFANWTNTSLSNISEEYESSVMYSSLYRTFVLVTGKMYAPGTINQTTFTDDIASRPASASFGLKPIQPIPSNEKGADLVSTNGAEIQIIGVGSTGPISKEGSLLVSDGLQNSANGIKQINYLLLSSLGASNTISTRKIGLTQMVLNLGVQINIIGVSLIVFVKTGSVSVQNGFHQTVNGTKTIRGPPLTFSLGIQNIVSTVKKITVSPNLIQIGPQQTVVSYKKMQVSVINTIGFKQGLTATKQIAASISILSGLSQVVISSKKSYNPSVLTNGINVDILSTKGKNTQIFLTNGLRQLLSSLKKMKTTTLLTNQVQTQISVSRVSSSAISLSNGDQESLSASKQIASLISIPIGIQLQLMTTKNIRQPLLLNHGIQTTLNLVKSRAEILTLTNQLYPSLNAFKHIGTSTSFLSGISSIVETQKNNVSIAISQQLGIQATGMGLKSTQFNTSHLCGIQINTVGFKKGLVGIQLPVGLNVTATATSQVIIAKIGTVQITNGVKIEVSSVKYSASAVLINSGTQESITTYKKTYTNIESKLSLRNINLGKKSISTTGFVSLGTQQLVIGEKPTTFVSIPISLGSQLTLTGSKKIYRTIVSQYEENIIINSIVNRSSSNSISQRFNSYLTTQKNNYSILGLSLREGLLVENIKTVVSSFLLSQEIGDNLIATKETTTTLKLSLAVVNMVVVLLGTAYLNRQTLQSIVTIPSIVVFESTLVPSDKIVASLRSPVLFDNLLNEVNNINSLLKAAVQLNAIYDFNVNVNNIIALPLYNQTITLDAAVPHIEIFEKIINKNTQIGVISNSYSSVYLLTSSTILNTQLLQPMQFVSALSPPIVLTAIYNQNL